MVIGFDRFHMQSNIEETECKKTGYVNDLKPSYLKKKAFYSVFSVYMIHSGYPRTFIHTFNEQILKQKFSPSLIMLLQIQQFQVINPISSILPK